MKEPIRDMAQRLRWCSHFEEIAAEAYERLAELFSDDSEAWSFFTTLSMEESDHANILHFITIYERPETITSNWPSPDWPKICKTMQVAEELLKKARSGKLSLEGALRLALELEVSTTEAYYFDMMKGEADAFILKRVREIFPMEETHAEKIRIFMAERDMSLSAMKVLLQPHCCTFHSPTIFTSTRFFRLPSNSP